MRALVLVLVVAASCKSEMKDYPVGGGGFSGGGGNTHVDAPTDGSGSGSNMARACVLTDPRDLTSCKTAGVAGLTVTLGTQTATTADDGYFTITAPTGTNVVWDVKGSTVVESVTPYAGQTKISVMDSQMFVELQGNVGAQPIAGTGGLLVRVTRGGNAVAGETAVVTPANQLGSYYDGATASSWTQISTGTFGTVFEPNVTSGSATLKLSAGGTLQATLSAIPITDGGVTFVVAELP